LIQSSG